MFDQQHDDLLDVASSVKSYRAPLYAVAAEPGGGGGSSSCSGSSSLTCCKLCW